MYQTPVEVLKKSEEEFKRERHLPESGGQRAAVASVSGPRAEDTSKKQVSQGFSFAGLRLKQRLEWSTEELLLLLLILWQLFCREHDYLLMGVLLFLLLFD